MPMEEVPHQFAHVYRDWSSTRHGWAVLVPNRYLSESSFHTGDTPSWTQGDVIAEGTNIGTGRMMVVVDLGGHDCERHMEVQDVRVANLPGIRAVGSEGGHGYGWQKRQHCFSPRPRVVQRLGAGSPSGAANGTMGMDDDSHSDDGLAGETEHCADNEESALWGSQPRGLPIKDYDVPEDEEGVDGTQNSTARMTFPKVSRSFPDFMQSGKEQVLVYETDESREEREG